MTTSPCDCVKLREQVRVMRKALESISTQHHDHCDYWKWQSLTNCRCPSWVARQTLNQDSLGDGK